jgi:hypothetical protein
MRLVKGNQLPETARREALAAFIYRWTSDNPRRTEVYKPCPGCDIRNPAVASSAAGHNHPTIRLKTDAEWLAAHAFWVTKAGRLAANRRRAEPAWMAESDV